MTYTTYPYTVKANGVYYPANTPVPVPDAAVETAAPAAEKAVAAEPAKEETKPDAAVETAAPAAEKAVAAEPAKEETKPDAAVETAAPAAEKAAKKSANKGKGRKAKSAD